MELDLNTNLAVRPDVRIEERNGRVHTSVVGFDVVNSDKGANGRRDVFIGNEGIDGSHGNLRVAALFAAAPDLYREALEAIQQIEYFHERFGATGSGGIVLAKLKAAIAKVENPQILFSEPECEPIFAAYMEEAAPTPR